MDFKKIMSEKKELSYPELYEMAMENKESGYGLPEEIKKLLKEKREFGLKKYGEFSFQSSLKNTLAAPTLEHLKEELIDAFNYTLHDDYKNKILGGNSSGYYRDLIDCLKSAWNLACALEKQNKM